MATGTISSANTNQSLLSANASRGGLTFQNTSTTANIYASFSGPAYSSGLVGIKLRPGDGFQFDRTVPVTELNVASDGVGASFTYLEY